MKLDRKQDLNVLYKVCVFGLIRKTKMAALASDWLSLFRLLPRNRWTEFNENFRKQDLNVLYQVCVFGPIGRTRWPPWPLIGWDTFDFSSETTEWNSTKFDRKQDLNVNTKFCIFRADAEKLKYRWLLHDRKNKMAALASDCLRNFRHLLWNS